MDERTAKREVVDMEVMGTFKGKPCRALLYDLSIDGCTIHTGGSFALRAGDAIQFDLPHADATEATVIWTKGEFGGARFTSKLHQAVVTQLGLRPRSLAHTRSRDQFERPVRKTGERFSF